MPPPQAGAVLHDLTGPQLSRIPFLVFLALICLGPVYFAPEFWFIGAGAFTLLAAFYMVAESADANRNRLTAVCENGLVISERGVDTLLPWTHVKTVKPWTYHLSTGYDIHTLEKRYRIDEGFKKGKLKPVIDTIVQRAPLEWMGEIVAVRPENAGQARQALDKALESIGR